MGKPKKVIISAAITGAIHTPSMSPYFPASPEQIAQQAIDASKAGAAVVHIHARRADGMPVGDFETFRRILSAIKEETDAVIGITTGGANGMSTEERFSVIEEFQPEMASANSGSMNFCYHKLAKGIDQPLYDWELPYLTRTYDNVFKNTFKDMEYCIRNWFNIKWLSGDHILDQAVHNIDIVTWFMGMRPQSATGFGGRVRRLTGDIYDNFAADYTYDGNKRMLCTARQIDGCEGNVSEQILGTKGVALLSNGNNIRIEDYQGNILWKYDYEAKPVKNPYNQEHIHLVESIRLDKKINQAMDLAYSTQVAILGREAAYTGKRITWDEIMASNLRYGPTEYALGPLPDYHEGEAPKPGKDPQAPM